MLLKNTDSWQAWDCFLAATPATGFMQSSSWVHFRAPIGFDHFGVTLKDGDNIVGGALVAKWSYAAQHCFYYIQDGPVLPAQPSEAARVFALILERIDQHRHAEEQIVSHLRIEPRWGQLPEFVAGFERPAFVDIYREPRNTLCVDLRVTDDLLLAQMRPKGRYNIRVAQRHGVAIVEDSSNQGITDFIRIQRRTARRQQIAAKPPSYFRELMAVMLPQRQASIFFAEYRGRRIAAALVMYFGKRATYFFGGSLVLHRRVMAPYLLHFEMMRSARALGYESYDFWGIAPSEEPDHPWQAITDFKRKFGGEEVRLVPTLDLVYDRAAYQQYIADEATASPASALSSIADLPNTSHPRPAHGERAG